MILKWDKEKRDLQEQIERFQSPRGHRRPNSENQGEGFVEYPLETQKSIKYPAHQEKRKLPKVKHHEVDSIGTELKYNMKLKKIPYNLMEKVRFNEC